MKVKPVKNRESQRKWRARRYPFARKLQKYNWKMKLRPPWKMEFSMKERTQKGNPLPLGAKAKLPSWGTGKLPLGT